MKTQITRVITTTAAAILAIAPLAQAGTVTLTVPGTSNPWLAGMPDGTTASPNESPVLVQGIPIVLGGLLYFKAVGGVAYAPSFPLDPPDGGIGVGSHLAGAQHGKSDITTTYNCLLGVFLDDSLPTLSPAPTALNFTTVQSRNFTNLAPALKQVFFIGDGRTTNGVLQQFVAPAGATRLFLGTMDGFGWWNNMGQFTVWVTDDGTFPASLAIYLYAAVENIYAAVEITGTVGRIYRVEYSEVLPTANWTTLTNVVLPVSPYLVFDYTGPATGRRYYRALELP